MADLTTLDNPVWHALTTIHQHLARSNGLAHRYPSDVSPLSALAEPTPQAFADMAALISPVESVGFFTSAPMSVPANWKIVRTLWIDQMICREIRTPDIAEKKANAMPPSLLPLAPADVPEMLALVAATKPGPFLARTIEMGRYFGIRSANGRLVAMAGERLRLNHFTEISAVCTDPEFRGAGYGRALVSSLAAKIHAENKIPFLHVVPDNGAKSVYMKVGFNVRRSICVTLISPL